MTGLLALYLQWCMYGDWGVTIQGLLVSYHLWLEPAECTSYWNRRKSPLDYLIWSSLVGRTPSLCLAQVLVPGEEEEEGAGWLADMWWWWWCGRRCTAVSCTLCDISCCVPDRARAFSATYKRDEFCKCYGFTYMSGIRLLIVSTVFILLIR
jgi:hypothetical protein